MGYRDKCEKCSGQLILQTPGARRIGYVCGKCGAIFSYDRLIPYYAKEKADKILEDWHDICAELDIDNFLVRGTCLGMVREKGHIKIHWDIDVFIREKDLPRVTEKLLEQGFMTTGFKFKIPSPIGSSQHFIRDEILLDVIFDLPDDTQFLKSEFDTATYEGKTYRLPFTAVAYLRHRYGPSWRIPWKA